eukprot:4583197-Alexandrium_andersonii.AAC.1
MGALPIGNQEKTYAQNTRNANNSTTAAPPARAWACRAEFETVLEQSEVRCGRSKKNEPAPIGM